jgi:hypothetical protein
MPGGRGYQFRYEPNIIKQIEERTGQVPHEDARTRVLAEVQGYFGGPGFKLASWPMSARQVQETPELQLALCENENIALSVTANADDSNAAAPMPRRFVNSILAVTATAANLNSAIERAKRLLAAEKIESSVNQRLPSGPTTIQLGPEPETGYSVSAPPVVIRPIMWAPVSVNRSAPSGPTTRASGEGQAEVLACQAQICIFWGIGAGVGSICAIEGGDRRGGDLASRFGDAARALTAKVLEDEGRGPTRPAGERRSRDRAPAAHPLRPAEVSRARPAQGRVV